MTSIIHVVEPEEVNLPVFISKVTNCFGVEDILSLSIDAIEHGLNPFSVGSVKELF